MNPERRKLLFGWLSVIVLCGAIFVQSCFPPLNTGPSFPLKDKVFHMAAYGLLAVLFYRACRLTWPDRISPVLLLVYSVGFSTLYGLSDEFHQSFVAGRHADTMDAVADLAGAVLGALGYMMMTCQGGRSVFRKRPVTGGGR